MSRNNAPWTNLTLNRDQRLMVESKTRNMSTKVTFETKLIKYLDQGSNPAAVKQRAFHFYIN